MDEKEIKEEHWDENIDWTRQMRKKSGGKMSNIPRVTINKRCTTISISHGCHFKPARVDIYTSPQGKGNGIKMALVESLTGDFNLLHRSKAADTDTRVICCKTLLQEQRIKPGQYDILNGRVHGKKAIIVHVEIER